MLCEDCLLQPVLSVSLSTPTAERGVSNGAPVVTLTHTHTHSHTERERDREIVTPEVDADTHNGSGTPRVAVSH